MNEERKSLLFLIILVTIVILISFGVVMADTTSQEQNSDNERVEDDTDFIKNNNVSEEENEKIDEKFIEIEQDKLNSLNVLLIGFDKSRALTDVIMVAHLDTETNEVKLISIPRDLFIDFRDEKFQSVKNNNQNNKIAYCKLTEVYYYAGWDDRALLDIKEIVGIITGLNIDYMAGINIDGFEEIIDIVGGIEFYIPQDMNYEDSYQDLHIHLKKGLQVLNGKQAEQLVRFRGYVGNSSPDKQRIQVQQDFMLALSNELLEIDNFEQIKQLLSKGYELLKTDFGLILAFKYAEYIYNLELNKVLTSDNMIIIPSFGGKMEDKWYELWDYQEVQKAVKDLIEK